MLICIRISTFAPGLRNGFMGGYLAIVLIVPRIGLESEADWNSVRTTVWKSERSQDWMVVVSWELQAMRMNTQP